MISASGVPLSLSEQVENKNVDLPQLRFVRKLQEPENLRDPAFFFHVFPPFSAERPSAYLDSTMLAVRGGRNAGIIFCQIPLYISQRVC